MDLLTTFLQNYN